MERDKIEKLVLEALPNLDHDNLVKVMQKMDELGVETIDDLSDPELIELKDFENVLKTVEARKLVKKFRNKGIEKPNNSTDLDRNLHTPTPITPPNATTTQTSEPFTINWDEIGHTQMLTAETMAERDKCAIINSVYDQMVSAGFAKADYKLREKVAEQMAEKYKNHFLDQLVEKVGDTITYTLIENGLGTTKNRLKDRQIYKLRIKNVTVGGRPSAEEDSNVAPKKHKKSQMLGCVEWELDSLPQGETKESQEELKNELIELYKNVPSLQWDVEDIKAKMDRIFYSIRLAINRENKSFKTLKEEFPFLFETKFMIAHYQRVTHVSVEEKVKHFINSYTENTIKHMTSTNKKSTNTAYIEIELQAMKAAREAGVNIAPSSAPRVLTALQMISKALDGGAENGPYDFGLFIRSTEVTATAEDVEQLPDLPSTPLLVALGSDHFTAGAFLLVLDGTVVCRTENFATALSALYASFYIFNIHYPQHLNYTWEFIQRFIMKVNHEGFRVSAGNSNSKNSISTKLVVFMKDLEKYNNWANSQLGL